METFHSGTKDSDILDDVLIMAFVTGARNGPIKTLKMFQSRPENEKQTIPYNSC